jgi:ABC-type Zn uptake system ZnuABC Zn-binding protein ZnuA
MKIELFDKVQFKNGKQAHIVEVYEQGIAYEADIDAGDGEYITDTIKHSDIQYVFAGNLGQRTAV